MNPTVDELEKKEEELFRTGPLSVLTTSVKTNSQVARLVGPWPVSVMLTWNRASRCEQPAHTSLSTPWTGADQLQK